jgi:hypothetical protein
MVTYNDFMAAIERIVAGLGEGEPGFQLRRNARRVAYMKWAGLTTRSTCFKYPGIDLRQFRDFHVRVFHAAPTDARRISDI